MEFIDSLSGCLAHYLCCFDEEENYHSPHFVPQTTPFVPRPSVVAPNTYLRNPLTSGYALESSPLGRCLIESGIVVKDNVSRYRNYATFTTNAARTSEYLYLSGGVSNILSSEGQKAVRVLCKSPQQQQTYYQNAAGQILTLPMETFVENILPYLRPRHVAIFGKVSHFTRQVVNSYVSLNQSVSYRLSQLNIAETQLAAILSRSATWAAIVGDFPLQIFLGERYPITEIKLYCGPDVQTLVKQYLLGRGYAYKQKANKKGYLTNVMTRLAPFGYITIMFGAQVIRKRNRLVLTTLDDVVKMYPTHLKCSISFSEVTGGEDVVSLHPEATRSRFYALASTTVSLYERYAAYGFRPAR